MKQRQLVTPRLPDWDGLRVTVMGLGRFGGGVAAVRFLCDRGARVTVTDRRNEHELADSLKKLSGLKLDGMFLGKHPNDAFSDRAVLVANPAVRPGNELVADFESHGIVTSETELLLAHLPSEVTLIAVTGSNGKSTTSSLIHHLLETTGDGRSVWLGGNIGQSLLPQLGQIQSNDIVVLELSSFQLWYLRQSGFAPDIAVVTNFSPNHLDWHGTLEDYESAKQILLARQNMQQLAVLPAEDDVIDHWRVRGRRIVSGLQDTGEDGAFVDGETLIIRAGRNEDALRLIPSAALAGDHSRRNIAAAVAVVSQLGADAERLTGALARFNALPHRMELVAQGNGIRFINDSNATTPESTKAALASLRGEIVLIAGGASKGVDLNGLAQAIRGRVTHAVLIGETSHSLAELIETSGESAGCRVKLAETLEAAFLAAVELVSEGGIVLLSPACASFGMFRDYRDRGEQFSKLAQGWTGDS